MGFFPSPYSYELIVTPVIGCPNACSYCPQKLLTEAYARRGGPRLMTLDLFKRYLDKVPPYVEIHLSGLSEPWVNPECTDMVLHAGARGHRLSVFSSLVGMRPADADRLAGVPFRQFSVHVPSDSGGEDIKVTQEYREVIRRVAKGIPAARFHWHAGELHPGLRDILGGVAYRSALGDRAGNLPAGQCASSGRRAGVLRCPTSLRANILLPNGDVLACCMDWGLRHVLGNLGTCAYADLFKGEEFRRLERGLLDENSGVLCRTCGSAEEFRFAARLRYHLDPRRYAGALRRLAARLLGRS